MLCRFTIRKCVRCPLPNRESDIFQTPVHGAVGTKRSKMPTSLDQRIPFSRGEDANRPQLSPPQLFERVPQTNGTVHALKDNFISYHYNGDS